MRISLRFCIILFSTLFFLACEDKDSVKIAETQDCINNLPDASVVTSAEVNVCMSKLGSLTNSSSYRLRCALNYIEQGFSNTQLQQAFDALDGGSSVMQNVAGALAFNKAGVDASGNNRANLLAAAEEAVTNCGSSGSKGLNSLALLSKTGSIFAQVAQTNSIAGVDVTDGLTSSELQTIAGNVAMTGGGSDEDLGSTAIALNSLYCGDNSTNDSACSQLSGYVNSGSASQIGAALRQDFD